MDIKVKGPHRPSEIVLRVTKDKGPQGEENSHPT